MTYLAKGLGVPRIGCQEAEEDEDDLEAGAMVVGPVWVVHVCGVVWLAA